MATVGLAARGLLLIPALLLFVAPGASAGVLQGAREGGSPPGFREDGGPSRPAARLHSTFERRLDAVIRAAIEDGATPGAAVVVGIGGQVVLSRGYGRVDWAPDAALVTDSTLYDLASMTKVVSTTVLAMRFVEEGRLYLDRPIREVLPGWPATGDHARVTSAHLLSHSSGLPAGSTLWREGGGRDEVIARIAAQPLASIPGTGEIYSDLDMILLGFVLEEVGGAPLDLLFRERVAEPLGLRETLFNPLRNGIARARIAPTERIGSALRWGEVHDPNAALLGGAAGHAGLFGSARDLARFASAFLWGRPGPPTCPGTLARFTWRPGRGQRFGLGWERPVYWAAWSDYLSDSAFGHTGFTGTSLWIDPERDLFVVLLTNRVNPTSSNEKHHALRRAVHEEVRRALVEPVRVPARPLAGPARGSGIQAVAPERRGEAGVVSLPLIRLEAAGRCRASVTEYLMGRSLLPGVGIF